MVGYESHKGFGIAGLDPAPFLNSLLFQFKSFSGTKEPFTPIPSFIPTDSEIFLLTVHFLKNWFFVRSGTDQINQKYFWNQKKV